MTITSRLIQIAAMAPLLAAPCAANAQAVSPWTEGFHSRVRLVSAGRQGDHLLAGIEITLDPGFKTYWREPGDSGLPPRFGWTGSENVGAVDLQWPAPERTEDGGGVAHGYHDRVVFPVLFEPKDASRPSTLAATIDYGVCKDICIPAHADLALIVTGDDAQRALVQPWLDRVPHARALGAPGALSIVAVEPVPGDKPTFQVAVRSPAGVQPTLFVEGPENWFFATGPAQADGRFVVTVEEKPQEATGNIPLRLTLVAGSQAVESTTIVNPSQRR